MESYLFLKLQRAHRRDGLEVMMEAGNAHAEFACDIINSERLVKVFAELFDCLRNSASGSSRSQEMAEPRALFSP